MNSLIATLVLLARRVALVAILRRLGAIVARIGVGRRPVAPSAVDIETRDRASEASRISRSERF